MAPGGADVVTVDRFPVSGRALKLIPVAGAVISTALAFALPPAAHGSVVCPQGTNNPAYCTSEPDVCVYVDSPVLGVTSGHVFVQLLPDRAPQKGNKNLVYGLSPVSAWHPFGGKGQITSNATHGWDYKICYPVSVQRYNSMANFIRRSIANPPNYDLLESNCVIWVENVAAVGGIRLPSSTNRAGIPDPAAFEGKLEGIGVGKTSRGGTVRKNPGKVAPNGGADPVSEELDADSYEGLEMFALSDPARLAAGLHLRDHELRLRPRTLGRAHALSIRLTNAGRAIVAIDWGDGSQTLQHTTASHTYTHPGRYRVRVVVVRDSTIFRVTLVERVRRHSLADRIGERVPHDGPQPNFPPAPAAPAPAALS